MGYSRLVVPEVNESPPVSALATIDVALMYLGGIIVLAAVVVWAIRGRRDPLRNVPERPNRLIPEAIVLPMAVWLLVGGALVTAAEWVLKGDALDMAVILAGNVAQLLGAIACLVLAARFFDGGAKRYLLGDGCVVRPALTGAVYLPASLTLCSLTVYGSALVLEYFDPQYRYFDHEVIDALRGGKSPLLVLWIGTTLIAPVAEECFFRGILQTGLENLFKSKWISVATTAAVFGAIHAGGGDTPQPHVVPALTLLGVLLGVVYLRSGSLVAPIVLHALFNAKTLLWETLNLHGA